MKKDCYYFSHDSNARNDEKILCLRAKFGMEGYGIFWAINEMLFNNPDTKIAHEMIHGIAYDFRIDITLLNTVITECIKIKLYDSDEKYFWSESLIRRKNTWNLSKQKKSEAGRKGMENRWKDNTVITGGNITITKHNKGKERKGKEIIKNNKKVFDDFESFRIEYPGKKRGHETEFENFKKQKDWLEILPMLLAAVRGQISERSKIISTPGGWVPEWKNLKTWVTNRCWEESILPPPVEENKIPIGYIARVDPSQAMQFGRDVIIAKVPVYKPVPGMLQLDDPRLTEVPTKQYNQP